MSSYDCYNRESIRLLAVNKVISLILWKLLDQAKLVYSIIITYGYAHTGNMMSFMLIDYNKV